MQSFHNTQKQYSSAKNFKKALPDTSEAIQITVLLWTITESDLYLHACPWIGFAQKCKLFNRSPIWTEQHFLDFLKELFSSSITYKIKGIIQGIQSGLDHFWADFSILRLQSCTDLTGVKIRCDKPQM